MNEDQLKVNMWIVAELFGAKLLDKNYKPIIVGDLSEKAFNSDKALLRRLFIEATERLEGLGVRRAEAFQTYSMLNAVGNWLVEEKYGHLSHLITADILANLPKGV